MVHFIRFTSGVAEKILATKSGAAGSPLHICQSHKQDDEN